jgi:hypothetical protein
MIADSIKAKLDDAKHVMRRQMEEIDRLRAENERLKANASAHQTLAAIYSDPNQPTGHRIKAAGLALGVETPRLESVPPAIDVTCEEIEPPGARGWGAKNPGARVRQSPCANLHVILKLGLRLMGFVRGSKYRLLHPS